MDYLVFFGNPIISYFGSLDSANVARLNVLEKPVLSSLVGHAKFIEQCCLELSEANCRRTAAELRWEEPYSA